MKKTIALLALAASSAAYAQLTALPTSLGASPDVYSNAALWDSQINSLQVSTGDNSPIATLAAGDGITMGGSAPSAPSDAISIRVIYFGETAGWWNDFGITFGAPTGTNVAGVTQSTADSTAKTLAANVNTGTPTSFTYWDIPITPATFANFDIWINASANTAGPDTTPTSEGGLYHAFHSAWDNPNEAAFIKAYWSKAFALQTNYAGGTVGAATYLLGLEDRRQVNSDGDHSDLILAVQFIDKNGRPNTGVPEPTTYGVIGAAALLGLITIRRRLQK